MPLREIIEIDERLCDGCGLCIPSCAEGALAVVDGKARLVRDIYCDGLGACVGECPRGALRVVRRDAESFDVEAVARASRRAPEADAGRPTAAKSEDATIASRLRQWPVQLALVPPFAPYLRGCDLLLTADCVPFAFADYHRRFLEGRVVLVGCPKLDDLAAYRAKLTEILRIAGIRSVTVLRMEVPCCGGIVQAVLAAREKAGRSLPLRAVTIGVGGAVLEDVAIEPGVDHPVRGGGCGGGCPSIS